jgi:hypothetical protein
MSAREVVTVDARAELRAALVAREVAREALASARAAADRAREMRDGAETRAHRFIALDGEIQADTAARISAWTSAGGEQPSLDPDPRFAEQIRRRGEAEQHCSAARAAVATLTQQLDAAERKFGHSEFTVAAAVTSVMIEEAKPLAERLIAARREAWRLEALLSSLMSQWYPTSGGQPRPISVGKDTLDAVNNREPPWRAPGASHEGEAWRSLRAELIAGNADATLERAP